MKDKTKLVQMLQEFQSNVIGIFVNPHTNENECILFETDHAFDTFMVTNLLGSSNSTYPKSRYSFEKFPNGKSLNDMKQDIYQLQEFMSGIKSIKIMNTIDLVE